MSYRIYLLDAQAHIKAGESFSAPDDTAAMRIAAAVHEACCDAFCGYELWSGPRRVVAEPNGREVHAHASLDDVIEANQENILSLEDNLQRTFACMRQSRKLLEITSRFHQC